MRNIVVFSLFLSLNAFAEDCRSEKIYHPENNNFLGCKVVAMTPSYRVRAAIPASSISESDCLGFCDSYTILPFPHGDHVHVEPLPRAFVNQVLDSRQTLIQAHPELGDLPPEMFLQAFLTTLLEQTSGGGDIPEELWSQHVQSMIHQKDPSKVLPVSSFNIIQKKDLPEADQDVSNNNAAKCTICCEPFASQMDQGKDVVQVNCVSDKGVRGNHIFCRECIEESYKYQQICPVCRGKIESFGR